MSRRGVRMPVSVLMATGCLAAERTVFGGVTSRRDSLIRMRQTS